MNESNAYQSVVLLIGASPSDQDVLLLSVEFDLIESSIRQGTHRDDVVIKRSLNTQSSELVPDLLRTAPTLVHFSGHGRQSGELVFEDKHGASAPLSPELLGVVFSGFSDSVKCVVLNACWSESQAEIIGIHIPTVAGMSAKVSDLASLNFSLIFYLSLSQGKPVSEAFAHAVSHLRLVAPDDAEAPMLRVREGAGEVVLAGPNRYSRSAAGTSTDVGSEARQDFISELFKRHYGPLVRIASVLLDNIPGAEATVRAAFVDLLYAPQLPAFGAEPEFLRRHVMAAASSLSNQQRIIAEAAGTSMAAKRARVLSALSGLPSPQSEVLVLKHLGALDDEQIGAVLNLTRPVVASNAAAGLDALGALLDEVAA